MSVDPDLARLLKRLKLGPLLPTLPERLVLARAQQLDYAAFLTLLLADEVQRRDQQALERRLTSAGFEDRVTLDDVDLERGTIKVMGKGQRERTVHVGATVLKLLSRYVRYLRPEPRSAVVRNLLLAKDGAPFTVDAAKHVMRRASVQSGVERLHAHLLRHTFATRYLLNGGDLLTLQRLLGHATLEMVQRYSHIAAGYVAVQHREYSPVDRVALKFQRKQKAPRPRPVEQARPRLRLVKGPRDDQTARATGSERRDRRASPNGSSDVDLGAF